MLEAQSILLGTGKAGPTGRRRDSANSNRVHNRTDTQTCSCSSSGIRKRNSLDYRNRIARLHANAERCRSLASNATDPSVREALTEIARDIEMAIPILEEDTRLNGARGGA